VPRPPRLPLASSISLLEIANNYHTARIYSNPCHLSVAHHVNASCLQSQMMGAIQVHGRKMHPMAFLNQV